MGMGDLEWGAYGNGRTLRNGTSQGMNPMMMMMAMMNGNGPTNMRRPSYDGWSDA